VTHSDLRYVLRRDRIAYPQEDTASAQRAKALGCDPGYLIVKKE
jgi:hypothetical protein